MITAFNLMHVHTRFIYDSCIYGGLSSFLIKLRNYFVLAHKVTVLTELSTMLFENTQKTMLLVLKAKPESEIHTHQESHSRGKVQGQSKSFGGGAACHSRYWPNLSALGGI